MQFWTNKATNPKRKTKTCRLMPAIVYFPFRLIFPLGGSTPLLSLLIYMANATISSPKK
jgi:hypothetical protein